MKLNGSIKNFQIVAKYIICPDYMGGLPSLGDPRTGLGLSSLGTNLGDLSVANRGKVLSIAGNRIAITCQLLPLEQIHFTELYESKVQ